MSAPELAPFVKVGGLADVVGGLPKTLEAMGHEVRVVCPLYGCVTRDASFTRHEKPLRVYLGGGVVYEAPIWETVLPGSQVAVYFIEYDAYFGRQEVYDGAWGSHEDNDLRYAFLCRATIDLCYHLDWIPEIIHAHDWPTALIPVMLKTQEGGRPLEKTATVLTVHNLQHQGMHHERVLEFAGLPRWLFVQEYLEAMGAVNFLKGGLKMADRITTVSHTYAKEIQAPEYGFGLDDVLRARAADLTGIVNGIDLVTCNPEADPLLPFHFSAHDLSGKLRCKQALQEAFDLQVNLEVPIFSAIARLFWQKGLDVFVDVADSFLDKVPAQIVLIGSGEPELEEQFRQLALRHKGRVAVLIGYKPQLVHITQAGSNFFVMPSRFEPCGLTQLYAMRYGSLPIVRETGGLVDTVQSYNPKTQTGTGLHFRDLTHDSLLHTLLWAASLYLEHPKAYAKLQHAAMIQDFSWKVPAKAYEEVYKEVLGLRGR